MAKSIEERTTIKINIRNRNIKVINEAKAE
jgi:hypothetical protein